MPWRRIDDLRPVYSASTLVAGDANVVATWPGAEAAGYPDDEYACEAGVVAIFDLNLLQPVVFEQDGVIRLLASFGGLGSKGLDDATLLAALEQPGSDEVWTTFDVTSGALAIVNADVASPDVPTVPLAAPALIGEHLIVFPCANGSYHVTAPAKVAAPEARSGHLIQLTIRPAAAG